MLGRFLGCGWVGRDRLHPCGFLRTPTPGCSRVCIRPPHLPSLRSDAIHSPPRPHGPTPPAQRRLNEPYSHHLTTPYPSHAPCRAHLDPPVRFTHGSGARGSFGSVVESGVPFCGIGGSDLWNWGLGRTGLGQRSTPATTPTPTTAQQQHTRIPMLCWSLLFVSFFFVD